MLGLHAVSEAPIADLGATSLSGQGAAVAASSTAAAGGRVQYPDGSFSAAATFASDSMRFRTSPANFDAVASATGTPNKILIASSLLESDAALNATANFTAAGFSSTSASATNAATPERARVMVAFSTAAVSAFGAAGREKWEPIDNDDNFWTEVY